MSQQEVADQLEIDRVTYINWENETFDVKSQYIPKLAEIFGVEISQLFTDDKKNKVNNIEIKLNSNLLTSQSVIINISDAGSTKLFKKLIEELVKNLEKKDIE